MLYLVLMSVLQSWGGGRERDDKLCRSRGGKFFTLSSYFWLCYTSMVFLILYMGVCTYVNHRWYISIDDSDSYQIGLLFINAPQTAG